MTRETIYWFPISNPPVAGTIVEIFNCHQGVRKRYYYPGDLANWPPGSEWTHWASINGPRDLANPLPAPEVKEDVHPEVKEMVKALVQGGFMEYMVKTLPKEQAKNVVGSVVACAKDLVKEMEGGK